MASGSSPTRAPPSRRGSPSWRPRWPTSSTGPRLRPGAFPFVDPTGEDEQIPKRGRYEIHDRGKSQDLDLAQFGPMSPRYAIVDRETGRVVDEAETLYAARQERRNWN